MGFEKNKINNNKSSCIAIGIDELYNFLVKLVVIIVYSICIVME